MDFDIIFISFDEENANENWEKLLTRYPEAKRVHGIKGIRNAHLEAACLTDKDHFFTLDGDNELFENFEPLLPESLESDAVYVWRAQNAVNGLIYGYGGVKLWSKKSFEKDLGEFVDHAMSATEKYIVVEELASTTCFNTSPFSAWKSGFREGAKLAQNVKNNRDDYSKHRLEIWMGVGHHQANGDWAILGAREGAMYSFFQESIDEVINDFDILKKEFSLREGRDPKEESLKLEETLLTLGFECPLLDSENSAEMAKRYSEWKKA